MKMGRENRELEAGGTRPAGLSVSGYLTRVIKPSLKQINIEQGKSLTIATKAKH